MAQFKIEGINGNIFEITNKIPRVYLQNENFISLPKIFTCDVPAVVRGIKISLEVSVSEFPGCKTVFIISIDIENSAKKEVGLKDSFSFGSGIYRDLAFAAIYIAEAFCELNDMVVKEEINHLPILQYVIEKK